MSAPAELSIGSSLSARETGLWTAAAAFAVFAHVAASLAFQAMTSSEPEVDATEAMVVELAQLPFAASMPVNSEIVSEEPPADAAEPVANEHIAEAEVAEHVPEEQTEKAVEEQTEQVEAEETILKAEPETTDAVQEEVADKVETAEMTEELADPVVSDIVIPQPRPERVAEVEDPEPAKVEPTPKRRAEKPAEKKPVKKAQEPEEKKPAAKQTRKAETKREAKADAQQAVQSKAATAQNVNPAKWNSAVRRALARGIRSVRGMNGTVHVAFVVGSSGSIVSARVIGSSGNGALDTKALGMLRSTRVPPPPPELPSSSRQLSIPLDFK
jgi:protein TonB